MANSPPPHSYGIQYVQGSPPRKPILRPLRQAMYDREPVGGPHRCVQFFMDNRYTRDKRLKDFSFTNMMQSGQLGVPLEYDFVSIGLSPVSADKGYLREYAKLMFSEAVLVWYVGQNTPIKRTPISMMSTRPSGTNYIRDDKTKKIYRVSCVNGELKAVEAEGEARWDRQKNLITPLVDSGVPSRYADMRTPDGKARRINSTESFRAELEFYKPDILDVIDVYVSMEGVLYGQI